MNNGRIRVLTEEDAAADLAGTPRPEPTYLEEPSEEPVAWMVSGNFTEFFADLEEAHKYAATIRAKVISLFARPQPSAAAAEPGMVLAPHYRGYAHLGTGQYLLNHSAAGEPAELVISIATDEEKAGRVVGDEGENPEGAVLQPEAMAVRLRFENVAGLDALEKQLRHLREAHFPSFSPVEQTLWMAQVLEENLDTLGAPKDIDGCLLSPWGRVDALLKERANSAAAEPSGDIMPLVDRLAEIGAAAEPTAPAASTDSARAALLWVLWHHQGGSSPVGQPIRFALGMGAHDKLTDDEIALAKTWGGAAAPDSHSQWVLTPTQSAGCSSPASASANSSIHAMGDLMSIFTKEQIPPAQPPQQGASEEAQFLRTDVIDFLRHVIDMAKSDHHWDAVRLNAEALIQRFALASASQQAAQPQAAETQPGSPSFEGGAAYERYCDEMAAQPQAAPAPALTSEAIDAMEALLMAYRQAVKLHDPNTDDVFTVNARNAIIHLRGAPAPAQSEPEKGCGYEDCHGGVCLPCRAEPTAQEMPPLPRAEYRLGLNSKERTLYDADQMLAYGRLCRSQPAQEQADGMVSKKEVCRTLNMLIEGECLPGSSLELLKSLVGAQEDQAQLVADAARYRWLRDQGGEEDWKRIAESQPHQTDAEVDAALREKGGV